MQDLTDIQDELLSLVIADEDGENKEKKEEDEAESTSEFVVPKRKCPRAIRHSPFYRVLSELIDARAPSIQDLRIDTLNNQETNREAFLIHLDRLPEHHLFAGYRLEGRHFSVDKTYRTSSQAQHGYAPIHYTESYSSETHNESITVHVYLSKQGQCLYSQIKKCSGNPEKITDLKIKTEQDELLKTNANTSIEVLFPLLNVRQERYLKLKKEADKLEAELTKLSSELQNHASLEAYKAKAKTFIDVIERLNQYTELADLRGQSLIVRLEKLERWSKEIEAAAQIAHPEPDFIPVESAETVSPVVKPEKSEELVKLYDKLMKNLQQSSEQLVTIVYSAENLKKIKEKHETIRETNQQLMVLFEFPDAFLNNPSRKKKAKRLFGIITRFMTDHEEQGSKLLKQEALQGNIEAVRDLFIMFGNKLDEKFYKELLDALVLENLNQKRKN